MVLELGRDCLRIQQIHKQELISPESDLELLDKLFGPLLRQMKTEYENEFWEYKLDHLIVGIITQLFKVKLMTWDPLKDPLYASKELKHWADMLRPKDVPCTFDTLLYSIWLPRLRQTVKYDIKYLPVAMSGILKIQTS